MFAFLALPLSLKGSCAGLLLASLCACTSPEEAALADSSPADTASDTGDVPIDADHDGYTFPDDCGDSDAGVHPGATETCNSVDDNCDGAIDEGVTSPFYPDSDGDGYGAAAAAYDACEMPEGYLSDNTDCDDADAATFPGANETCTDPTDRNCDGTVSFADADGDGSATCVDCDDADGAVYPGAAEVMGDGVDQDCDGVICQAGPEGSVSIWRGEDDLTDEVGGRDGTAYGSVSYASGMVGDAIDFAPGSSVSGEESGLPLGGGDRTVAFWMYMDNAPLNEAIFAAYGNLGVSEEAFVVGSTGRAPFFSQWGSALFGAELSLHAWHLIAVSTIGDQVTLFVDGVVANAGVLPIHTTEGTGVYMGTLPGDLAAGRAFDGRLDEVMIWERAMSEAEVAELYAIGEDGTCP